jgi:hypothetical protein
LNACYVLGTVPGACDTAINKTEKILSFMRETSNAKYNSMKCMLEMITTMRKVK